MYWETRLEERLETLGDNPTKSQCEKLESWILDNVPQSYWGDISFSLPSTLATEFSMRAAEWGY